MAYAYKEHLIPKKNGKFRKIVAPNKQLLSYQRNQLTELERIYHRTASGLRLQEVAHGFLKGRNCVTCAEKHIGYASTVIMDLSNFFDTVTQSMFDKPLLREIAKDSKLWHKDGYAAQGFATSPILANIAIIPAMRDIQTFLEKNFPSSVLTIYADDIQISSNLTDSVAIMEEIVSVITAIIEKHGFSINTSKTRIRYAKYGYRRILGINVGDEHVRASRRVMRKIRAAAHQNNGSSLGGLTTWSQCHKPKDK